MKSSPEPEGLTRVPSSTERPVNRDAPARWWNGVLLGSLGMLAFSGTLPATRLAVPAFGPTIITFGRIEVAAVLGALTILAMRRWRLPDRRHWWGILWMGLGLAIGYPFFVALALQHAPAAHGAVVIGLAPAVTALIAVARAGRIVLLGCGPLLLLTAHQLADTGANIVGLLQTTTPFDFMRAIPHLPAVLRSPALLKQGFQLLAGMPHIPKVYSVSQAEIVGDDSVEGVEYQVGGASRFVECDTVLLHFGVIPNTQLTRLAGAAHGWNKKQEYWFPIVDKWQETSIENLTVAGDGGGSLGDQAAEISGRLSIHRIAHRMGRISDQSLKRLSGPLQSRLARLADGRAFIDAIFRTPESILIPTGETTVCRCEEISAGDIEVAIALGGAGLRQVKVHTRVGMGRLPCADVHDGDRGDDDARIAQW